ncbi:hypothetical protein KIW84_073434 [Lathyrus oleraceus]|uniref:Uncharacterized protein n=1 Tax=Pisum sativum TaxID=3888 RepID=A0A9D4ZYM1_PEA|nr:hypothetical protein KIW84_073434 [Pisum sativum]
MSPPKNIGASKKQRMRGRSSCQSRPFNANHFHGAHQVERFIELEKRKILFERRFNINREWTYREVALILEKKKWYDMINPPKHIKYDVVREFDANALPDEVCSLTLSAPINYLKEDIRPGAQIVLLLIFHNIKPRLHCSSSPLDTTHIANSILRDKQVDVARTIANELKMVAESGRIPGAKANFPLVFSAFIMSICARGRVHIPLRFHEILTGTIDGM